VKIEQLDVSGLRSHRGNPPTHLDLSDKRLVAIVGHTGAGKSSLLEAITFALFGEATYGGKAYEELSSDGRTEISVQMVFTVGEERFQTVRTVKQDRNGIFGTKTSWLRRVDAEGNTLTHVEGVRKVDAAVSNLLGGMSREQFCQAVLLAQNRFAALLEAEPRDRDALLDTLLGLGALSEARKALQATRKAAQRNLDRLVDKRALLPADPAAEARQAKSRAVTMKAIAKQAEEGAKKLSELSTSAAKSTKEADELEAATAMRTTPGGPDGLTRLADAAANLGTLADIDEGLQDEEKQTNKALDAAQKRQMIAASNLAAIEEKHGRAGRHEAVAEQLRQLGELLDEKPGHEKAAANSEAAVTKVQGELDGAVSAATVAKALADTQREAERGVQEVTTSATAALTNAERAVEAAEDAVARLGRQSTQVAAAHDGLGACNDEVAKAEQALTPVANQRDEARRALDEAQRSAAAATAAHGCHPGDECPVCDRPLPDDWTPPVSGDLNAAHKAVAEAEAAFDKAGLSHRRATEKRVGVVSRLRTALSEVSALHGELGKLAEGHQLAPVPSPTSDLEPPEGVSEQIHAAAAAVGSLRTEAEAWATRLHETLVPLRQARDTAEEKLRQVKQTRSDAESSEAEAERKANDAKTMLASATSTHEASVRALQNAEKRFSSTLSGVDERWRSVINLAEPKSVAAASAMLADDQDKVDAAMGERESADSEVRSNEQAIQALERQRATEVSAPLAGIVGLLATLTDVVNDLGARLGVPQAEPIDKEASAPALVKATKGLEATAKRSTDAAFSRIAELRAEVAALVSPATELVVSLVTLVSESDPAGTEIGEAPDPDNPLGTDTHDSMQRMVGGARRLAKEATTAAEVANRAVKTAKDLDKRVGDLNTWRADLDGAIDVLKKDNFPTWARNVRIADLVDTASEILSEMTSSRYRFDSALRISDEIAGIVRKASTLSGGEKFEASLALALGVSEIAGRSGVRIDTLFLDEGFAGLDQAHLNRALDALENEVEAGRCIVLITHIGSVADRIQDVLLVQPDGAGGSTMKWLNEEERFELGADLDLAVP
jgi:exonuclease SbcC